ncbi:hypothetical protein [Halobellus clavatus]|jgi:hypothetical protein|uniref:Uncharacterized protein n=1 Tax=Halobellus clavatus TaxID=660517 RepID=A0A1H3H5Z7_9EURY|nr:hypothetical protein [Halobellus clavatus]SDY10164.1 hypothetical protein SAMN04487946_106150 [Halobellus clavatus]
MKTANPRRFNWRRPEYTGQNRCLPCTVVNIVIAATVTVGLAAVSPPAAAAFAAVGVAAIYFRGYLIPGTPALTKRYLPDAVRRLFEHDSTLPAFDSDSTDAVDVERFLVEAGALERCRGDEDLCLSQGFREAWNDRLESLETAETSTIGPLFDGLDVEGPIRTDARPNAFVALVDAGHLGQWESETAFLADLAADAELRIRVGNWAEVPYRTRLELLGALRIWLDHCPDCGGVVSLDEGTVESCCRSVDVVAATCDDCGTRLFEARLPPGGLRMESQRA